MNKFERLYSPMYQALFFVAVICLYQTLLARSDLHYPDLNHKVFVEKIRAGNHDPSGVNDYYFQFEMRGVKNSEDARGIEIDKRPFVSSGVEEFAKVTVESLAIWDVGIKDENAVSFGITGDSIRVLVAKSMRELNVSESEVGLQVIVSMYEKAKWLYFFGENTLVGSVEYFAIPISFSQVPSRTNLKLEIVDNLGTNVAIKVKYEKPLTPSKEKSESEQKSMPVVSPPVREDKK